MEEPAAAGRRPRSPTAPFAVAYEDEHLLVVDKPPGVVVHPARGHGQGTLVQALAGRVAGGERSRARRASCTGWTATRPGCSWSRARTPCTPRSRRSWPRRELVREYLALVEGRPPARSGTIDAPLGRDRRVRTRISTDTEDGREAVTHFEIEQALPHDTLLRVRLETGRTHQIRAHLLAIGHPVAGDPEYGTAGRHGLERQFLHAARLAFPHPVTSGGASTSSRRCRPTSPPRSHRAWG